MGTIVLTNVSKTFFDEKRANVLAVDNVSLEIPDKEIVCVVGPSGCGKSTVLNIIAGFEESTSGDTVVDGRSIQGAGPDRMVVFQRPALFGWMTVYENIVLGPKKQGVSREDYECNANRFIKAVGLTEFASHYPYQLSGGMQQRVQIARALVNQPEILLMDEPFGALDFQTRLQMQELLLKVCSEFSPTILFITHDVDEAIFLGNHVYVMSRRPGRLKEKIKVPFTGSRTTDIMMSPKFAALKGEILQSIKEEMVTT